jgi:hypothetical protein
MKRKFKFKDLNPNVISAVLIAAFVGYFVIMILINLLK